MKKMKSILMLLILSFTLSFSSMSGFDINPCAAEPPYDIDDELTGW